MKRRKWIYGTGVLLLIVSVLIFLKNAGTVPESGVSSGSGSSAGDPRGKGRRADESNTRAKSSRQARNEEFRFAATELPSPPEGADALVYPKYQAGGSPTRGGILDQEGNFIRRATPESPIAAITISPNEEMMWISGGDKKSYIINAKGEEIANLPLVPPGTDMLRFGKWVWLDNHRLLGDSGIQNYDENGNPVTCCGGDDVSEIRLYVYDLQTGQIEEMQLPAHLRGKVVRIGKVLKTGELQLGHEGEEFGWYRIVDREEEKR